MKNKLKKIFKKEDKTEAVAKQLAIEIDETVQNLMNRIDEMQKDLNEKDAIISNLDKKVEKLSHREMESAERIALWRVVNASREVLKLAKRYGRAINGDQLDIEIMRLDAVMHRVNQQPSNSEGRQNDGIS